MAKSKKYDLKIEQKGDSWTAQITRQVTSRKTTVTKEQDGFNSEDEAMAWGQEQLSEFTKTQGISNVRHGEQRREQEEIRRQRSSRRAEKTAQEKQNTLNDSKLADNESD